jgi:hypothetical protein
VRQNECTFWNDDLLFFVLVVLFVVLFIDDGEVNG